MLTINRALVFSHFNKTTINRYSKLILPLSGIRAFSALNDQKKQRPVQYKKLRNPSKPKTKKRYPNYQFENERKEYAKIVSEYRRKHKEEYWNL